MDFNDTSAVPIQVINLTDKDYIADDKGQGVAEVQLFYVKFQKVKNLTFFVENSIFEETVWLINEILETKILL
jgi:hypothetical protein